MPSFIGRFKCFASGKKAQRQRRKRGSGHENLSTVGSGSTTPTRKIGCSETSSKGSRNFDSPQPENHFNDDDDSIPTMDSDYKKVNSGNFSLSDAGGTMGSQNQSLTNFTSAFGSQYGASSLAGGDRLTLGSAADDIQMASPVHQQSVREEMLEIYAPGGKLGLVIDHPETSETPVVHAIKDTCPIRDEIYVGDRLVAVDDVDVRDMSAVEVSRLISKRSHQERRKLTIIRVARASGGGILPSMY